jgi:hypothetical protein
MTLIALARAGHAQSVLDAHLAGILEPRGMIPRTLPQLFLRQASLVLLTMTLTVITARLTTLRRTLALTTPGQAVMTLVRTTQVAVMTQAHIAVTLAVAASTAVASK